MPIDDTLQRRLRTQTPIIHQLATADARGELPRVSFGKPEDANDYTRSFLNARYRLAKRRGLLPPRWNETQAEVAALHGLAYLSDGNRGRWILLEQANQANVEERMRLAALKAEGRPAQRADNYFDTTLAKDSLRTSVSAVDVALLAHSCGMPVESWLDPSAGYLNLSDAAIKPKDEEDPGPLFKTHLNWVKYDRKNLFANSLDFLEQFSDNTNLVRLNLFDRQGVLKPPPAPHMAPGMRIIPDPAEDCALVAADVRTDEQTELCLGVPEAFRAGAEFLLLEKNAEGKVFLASTGLDTNDTLLIRPEEGELRLPCSPNRDGKPRRFRFGPVGTSRLLTLFLKPQGTASELEQLDIYQRSTAAVFKQQGLTNRQWLEAIEWREADFAQLRQLLLRRPKDDWELFHRDLLVGAPAT